MSAVYKKYGIFLVGIAAVLATPFLQLKNCQHLSKLRPSFKTT